MPGRFSYEATCEMRIYPLFCGGDLTDWAVFDPFDERVGTKVFNPYFVYVITHPNGTVLFDTAAHPVLRTDAASRLGPVADTFEVRMSPDDWLVPKLTSIGMTPDDVTHVVQSHLHFDHAGGLEFVRHAKVYVQRQELEFARKPPVYQQAVYVANDFEHDLDWVALDGELDMFGDGSLVILPTPGHTKGHQSLLVRLKNQTVFLLGDAAYLKEKMRARTIPAVCWSPDAFIDTWEKVEAIERQQGAVLVTTHELDYEQSVPMAPRAWFS